MDIKQGAVVVVVAVILSILGVWALGLGSKVTQTIVRETSGGGQNVGALAGPDIPSPYLNWGGVRVWHSGTDALNQASTTACAIQTPASTSTLQLGSGIRLDISSSTATTVKVYKGPQPTNTTTFLFGANVAADAQAAVAASTSADTFVVAPNQFINVVMAGGTGTFTPSGHCAMSFIEL